MNSDAKEKKKAAPGARYGLCIERRKNGIGWINAQHSAAKQIPSIIQCTFLTSESSNGWIAGILHAFQGSNKGKIARRTKQMNGRIEDCVDKLWIVINKSM